MKGAPLRRTRLARAALLAACARSEGQTPTRGAMTYVALGDAAKADEQHALSIATYEAMVERYPHTMPVRQKLHIASGRYAQFKRQVGDEASARALDARAAN